MVDELDHEQPSGRRPVSSGAVADELDHEQSCGGRPEDHEQRRGGRLVGPRAAVRWATRRTVRGGAVVAVFAFFACRFVSLFVCVRKRRGSRLE